MRCKRDPARIPRGYGWIWYLDFHLLLLALTSHFYELAIQSGEFNYATAFGTCSPKEPLSGESLLLDAPMWIASCTKLMTAIAATQCVECGQRAWTSLPYPFSPNWKIRDLDIVRRGRETDPAEMEGPITLRSA